MYLTNAMILTQPNFYSKTTERRVEKYGSRKALPLEGEFGLKPAGKMLHRQGNSSPVDRNIHALPGRLRSSRAQATMKRSGILYQVLGLALVSMRKD